MSTFPLHRAASKQGLAINLPWPALKSKQHTYIELFAIISWSVWILILFYYFWRSTITNYWKHFPQSICVAFISPVCYLKKKKNGWWLHIKTCLWYILRTSIHDMKYHNKFNWLLDILNCNIPSTTCGISLARGLMSSLSWSRGVTLWGTWPSDRSMHQTGLWFANTRSPIPLLYHHIVQTVQTLGQLTQFKSSLASESPKAVEATSTGKGCINKYCKSSNWLNFFTILDTTGWIIIYTNIWYEMFIS